MTTTSTSVWTCWRDATHTTHNTQWGWPQCVECQAAPQYHERGRYVYNDVSLVIYVPIDAGRLGIDPGSALVGLPVETSVDVHYEGWKYGAAQYANRDARGRWEAGIQHAAGRMVTAYPTSARVFVGSTLVRAIGTYHPSTDTITVFDEEALESWLTT